jgi:hypothetical protein
MYLDKAKPFNPNKMKLIPKTLIAAASVLGLFANQAKATELLINGNFETGTFLGWTVSNLPGSGNVYVDAPGTTTPLSSHATVGTAANGGHYAVTDMTGGGTHALLQTFTVGAGSSVIFSFDLFANNWSGGGTIVNPAGLTHSSGPNQHARVDILTASASAFATTGGVVLGNFYLGADAGTDPNPFTSYSFDITSLVGAGGTFQVRFAETDNQLFFNMGVDNVSITSSVPDVGATVALLGLSFLGFAAFRRRFVA